MSGIKLGNNRANTASAESIIKDVYYYNVPFTDTEITTYSVVNASLK
jgi:hypothetical protein